MRKSIFSLLAFVLAFSVTSLSSDEPSDNQDAEETLEVVTVTATRRETDILDTPVAVSAVTQSELTELGISSIKDLSYALPGLAIQNTCLLYTSPSPRDLSTSRMPSSA